MKISNKTAKKSSPKITISKTNLKQENWWKQVKTSFATASFVLALVGTFLSFTIIGTIIWIPIMILAIIFWIIALIKKHHNKWMSIVWIIISWFILLALTFIAFWIKNTFAEPIIEVSKEIQAIMEDDTEVKSLMENPGFQIFVQSKLQDSIKENQTELQKSFQEWNIDLTEIIIKTFKLFPTNILEAKEEWKTLHSNNSQ